MKKTCITSGPGIKKAILGSDIITVCIPLSFKIRASVKLSNASWVMNILFLTFCCYRIIKLFIFKSVIHKC